MAQNNIEFTVVVMKSKINSAPLVDGTWYEGKGLVQNNISLAEVA